MAHVCGKKREHTHSHAFPFFLLFCSQKACAFNTHTFLSFVAINASEAIGTDTEERRVSDASEARSSILTSIHIA